MGVNGSGGITVGTGSCISDALVDDFSGVASVGGEEPNPHSDNQKYGIPTAGSLGITTASQIGILFNATEPGGDSANVTDLTLKFYSSTGALLGAIDGQQNFLSTNPGNGIVGRFGCLWLRLCGAKELGRNGPKVSRDRVADPVGS